MILYGDSKGDTYFLSFFYIRSYINSSIYLFSTNKNIFICDVTLHLLVSVCPVCSASHLWIFLSCFQLYVYMFKFLRFKDNVHNTL